MDSDFELLERWRGGDSEAGEQLFSRNFEPVFRFFRNKVGTEASDLTQRTFLACVEKRHSIDDRASFRSFLFGVARYELLGHLRRVRREHGFDPGVTSIAAAGVSPSTAWARKQDHKRLLVALQQLPIDAQVLLELSYWEHMNSTELAQVLEIPAPTVRSRLRKARSLLLEAMADPRIADGARELTTARLEAWAAELGQSRVDPESGED